VTVAAEMPFGLVHSESGDWQWMNPTGAFRASLDFPKTDLAVFRPFLPAFQRLSGSLAGRLDFSGTVGSPQTNGKIEWHDGALAWPNRMPPIEKTEALITFDGQALRLERFCGEMGSGPFEITGGIGLANPADPKWDLRFEGRNILFAKSPTLTIPANVELKIHADNAGGSVAGSAHLAGARISKRLTITPLLQTPDDRAQGAVFQPPAAEKGSPFADWTLNVKIDSTAPILIPGTIAPGRILPELTLQGTLSAPVPVGRITLSEMQAFLPAATLNIAEGHMDFLPDAPWNPLLDVQGTVQTPDFIIRANAFGPLNERKLLLRSEPPLTQKSIVLLLQTGNPGGGRMSKPDSFSLPPFAKQLEQPTLSPDSFLNRLLSQEISNDLPASQAENCSSFLQPADGCLRPKPEGFSAAPVTPSYTWEFQ
jgi:translocation and assembly module TamB